MNQYALCFTPKGWVGAVYQHMKQSCMELRLDELISNVDQKFHASENLIVRFAVYKGIEIKKYAMPVIELIIVAVSWFALHFETLL